MFSWDRITVSVLCILTIVFEVLIPKFDGKGREKMRIIHSSSEMNVTNATNCLKILKVPDCAVDFFQKGVFSSLYLYKHLA
jgi:hypothetical protein